MSRILLMAGLIVAAAFFGNATSRWDETTLFALVLPLCALMAISLLRRI